MRAPLKAREFALDLKERVGRYTIVTAATPLQNRGGYYCDVCDCLLKDSSTYLDHINGRPHQKKLGMGMYVERSTLAQVGDEIVHANVLLSEEKQIRFFPPFFSLPVGMSILGVVLSVSLTVRLSHVCYFSGAKAAGDAQTEGSRASTAGVSGGANGARRAREAG